MQQKRSLKTKRNIEAHYLTCSAVTGHPDIGVLAVLVYFNIVLLNRTKELTRNAVSSIIVV